MTTRETFLAERRLGIGGSDVAPILGLSPFRTALDVFRDKVLGPDDDTTDERRHWGNLLEPLVRKEALRRLAGQQPDGLLLSIDPHLVVGSEPWMRANVDGLVGDDAILEVKTAGVDQAADWGDEGTDDIPEIYLCQVAYYLAVTARSLAHVAVLIGGNDFRLYRVPRNLDLEAAIMERCRAFWFDNVTREVPPEVVSLADAKKRWRGIAGSSIEATPETLRLLKEREALKEAAKLTTKMIENVDFQLRSAMGDAEAILLDGSPLATLKTTKRAAYTVDATEFRQFRLTKWWDRLNAPTTKTLEMPT